MLHFLTLLKDDFMENFNYDFLSKEMILYRDYTQNTNMNFHTHNFYEIVIAVKGRLSYLVEKNVYNLSNSEILFVNNIEVHKPSFNDPEDAYERIFVHFSILAINQLSSKNFNLADCFIQRSLGERNKVTLSETEHQDLNTILEEIEKRQIDSQPGAELLKVASMLSLLVFLNRVFNNSKISDNPINLSEKIVPLLDYIEENIHNPLSLDQLEKIFYINRFYLSRLFKKEMGVNIHEYITLRRISNAKKLLSQGFNVTKVFSLCGFRDYTSFIRCFKKVVGVPPGRYKRLQD